MKKSPPDVSIVLVTYNGEATLAEVLTSIFNQKTRFTYEVIAVDSSSSDRSLDILQEHPVRVIQIPNREFGHGRTRNLGARYANGKYVVFLTQDAAPANEYWLENLVRPFFENQNVAGVYSRQLPRANCYPWESRDIHIGAQPISALKRVDFRDPLQKEAYDAHQFVFIAFSNVSSCIPKAILDRLPFAENIIMMEDQEWCKRAIESGYSVVYEASSTVRHSHNHSLRMVFRRHFDYGRSLRDFATIHLNLSDVLLYAISEFLADSVFIFKQGLGLVAGKWIAQSLVVRFAMRYGLYRGLQSRSESAIVNDRSGTHRHMRIGT
jgi:rhamnosyltransferase